MAKTAPVRVVPALPPHERLRSLAADAVKVAATAKRNRKSLDGANFYADRLAELRTRAEVAVRELAASQAGDAATLKALVARCFSPSTEPRDRLAASRELKHELATSWSSPRPARQREEDGVFPLEMLKRRGYLASIGRQANGCFSEGWYDACGVMMRRLLEIAIIEAFERRGLEEKLKNDRGEYPQLTELAKAALAERWDLSSRRTRPLLLALVEAGHRPAHGKLLTYRKYIEEVKQGYRDAVEDFLRIGDLL